MQAQLNDLLGLHRTSSRVSIDSLTSFAGSTNTKKAFKKFCENLYKIGVRAEMIKEKESEILNVIMSHNTATSGQRDERNTMDQSQLPTVSNCFGAEYLLINTLLTKKISRIKLDLGLAGFDHQSTF